MWQLPDALAIPIAYHHETPPQSEHNQSVAIAHASDYVAAVFSAGSSETAIRRARALLTETFGFDEDAIDNLLGSISHEVEQTAAALGMAVGPQPEYEDIVRTALKSLVDMNLSYEQLVAKLESAIVEKQNLADELSSANADLQRLANIDPLTSVSNRRHFQQILGSIIDRSNAEGTPVSLVYIDLDHFKSINDRYGHPVGDALLRMCATAFTESVRDDDAVARMGGEEFAVVLPNTPEHGGRVVAERIRQRIEACVLEIPDESVRATVSVGGVTTQPGDPTHTIEEMMRAADQALYRSKSDGRNRVTWTTDPA